MIGFASYYYVFPRIADSEINKKLDQVKSTDRSDLIPGEVRYGQQPTGTTGNPSISSIPLSDKLQFSYVNWKDVPASTDELGVRIVIPAIEISSNSLLPKEQRIMVGREAWNENRCSSLLSSTILSI